MAGIHRREQENQYSRVSRHRSLAFRGIESDNLRRSIFTENFINSFGTGVSSSRNAQLAALKFYSCSVAAGGSHQDQLLSSCWEYFKDFSTKVACFHDLQPYISSLERSKQEELIVLCGDVAREIRPKSESSEVSTSSGLFEPC